ncbi:ABC transporter permease subunit [Saccharopolyspora sp. NPDC047091]|uniref:ABC transporter permease subunit n=1 Tax=Saccharopolyspora sp. NPDC047091 TaxID=3155924 RepID=UPI003405C99B
MPERSSGPAAPDSSADEPWADAGGRETEPLSSESERHRAAIARALESGGLLGGDSAEPRGQLWGSDAMLPDDPPGERDVDPAELTWDVPPERADAVPDDLDLDLPVPEAAGSGRSGPDHDGGRHRGDAERHGEHGYRDDHGHRDGYGPRDDSPRDWTSPTWEPDEPRSAGPDAPRPAEPDDPRSAGADDPRPAGPDGTERPTGGRPGTGVVESIPAAVVDPPPAADEETAAALPVSAQDPTQPDGSVQGYQVRRTLPVRVELARQAGRRRTRLALGFLVLLPLLLLAAFEIGDDGSVPRTADLSGMATSGGLNFTAFAVSSSGGFLLVLVVALFFGDTVASEASWSSLRYLLAAPVPRGRLLRQKAVVAALLSLLGIALLPAMALAAGLFWYGTGELVTPSGSVLSFPVGLLTLVLAVLYLAVQLSWVAGLALWLSVSTDAPLGAVGGAVLVSILSQILDQISALGGLRSFLPTHYAYAWGDLLAEEVDWTGMANGACSSLVYAAVFVLLAHWSFRRKDITS